MLHNKYVSHEAFIPAYSGNFHKLEIQSRRLVEQGLGLIETAGVIYCPVCLNWNSPRALHCQWCMLPFSLDASLRADTNQMAISQPLRLPYSTGRQTAKIAAIVVICYIIGWAGFVMALFG